MTLDETQKVLRVLMTADGGCCSCGRSIIIEAAVLLPDAPWLEAFNTLTWPSPSEEVWGGPTANQPPSWWDDEGRKSEIRGLLRVGAE